MIKKLIFIGLLTIVLVFLNGCLQEKASIKPAETVNQSAKVTPAPINQSSMVTPTVQPAKTKQG